MPLVSLLTLLPFVGGIAVLLLGRAGRSAARLTAAVFATAAVAYDASALVPLSTCARRNTTAGIACVGAGDWACLPRGLRWTEPADAGSLLDRRAHGRRRFLEQSETRSRLFFLAAVSGDGPLRHLYGTELSPLVSVLGTEPDTGVFPDPASGAAQDGRAQRPSSLFTPWWAA